MQAQIKILNLMDKKEKTAQALTKKKSTLMELEAQAQKVFSSSAFFFLFRSRLFEAWLMFIMWMIFISVASSLRPLPLPLGNPIWLFIPVSLLPFSSFANDTIQLHKEIALIRDNEITESLYKETICDGRKNVVKLENRLDVITKRCGGVMAENAKLREIIDHMLQERWKLCEST